QAGVEAQDADGRGPGPGSVENHHVRHSFQVYLADEGGGRVKDGLTLRPILAGARPIVTALCRQDPAGAGDGDVSTVKTVWWAAARTSPIPRRAWRSPSRTGAVRS